MWSAMAAKMSGFSTDQLKSSDFVTVTKSEPKKTCFTPSVPKIFLARGDFIASLELVKLALPDCNVSSQIVQTHAVLFHCQEKW